jgi:predicted AlkP superfamily phosphohydrolase/phosphomutase
MISRTRTAALACIAVAVAVTVTLTLALVGCARQRESARPRVVLLGFDGASWDTIEPSIANGSLPYLQELRERSAWSRLETFKPTKSPVIWTSIATGKSMEKHGILDFVYLEENDLQVPYSNSERREPSLWQILDKFGKRSAVINWFVTYPPDVIDGTVVSNRFRRALLLNERRRDEMSDTVYPQERFAELRALMDTDYARVRHETGLPDLAERFTTLHPTRELSEVSVLKDFSSFVLQDALIERVSRNVYASDDFDLFAAYFRLPDIVQHVALHLVSVSPEDPEHAQKEIALLLEPFYRYLERIVEHYVTTSPEGTTIILVSDHGFALHQGGYDHYHIPADMPPPDGIFLMHGPSVVPGRLESVSVYDIAPTVLHLYGLPVGRAMDGRPVVEALDFDREVEYERYTRELMRTTENQQDEEIDQKTLEELRSLGYIK